MFQLQADKIAIKGICLIYPGARWIHQSGKGMKEFGRNLINDRKLSKLKFYPNSQEVFGRGIVVEDGVSIVYKDQSKTSNSFKYIYSKDGVDDEIELDYPGDKLISLNPNESSIINKIQNYISDNNLKTLNQTIMSQKLFGIESDFVEKNPDLVEEFKPNSKYDFSKKIKLFTNDKAGKAGRAKWYIANRDVISQNSKYIDYWKVVASSAKPGGHQGRDNQLEIMDNNSAFGRSRVAFAMLESKREAENCYKYFKSNFIKFCLLSTDDSLTSVGRNTPVLNSYKSNEFIDFDKDIDIQLYEIFNINKNEQNYIKKTVLNAWNKEEE